MELVRREVDIPLQAGAPEDNELPTTVDMADAATYNVDLLNYAHGMARKRIHNPEDAEDAAQEALLNCFRAKAKAENPLAYVRQAVVRSVINQGRRADARPATIDDGIDFVIAQPGSRTENVVGRVCDLETLRELSGLITRLSTVQQEALLLKANGLDYGEIAVRVGCNNEAARNRVDRARAKLERLLKQERDEA